VHRRRNYSFSSSFKNAEIAGSQNPQNGSNGKRGIFNLNRKFWNT
jgi:hypothetical protein